MLDCNAEGFRFEIMRWENMSSDFHWDIPTMGLNQKIYFESQHKFSLFRLVRAEKYKQPYDNRAILRHLFATSIQKLFMN